MGYISLIIGCMFAQKTTELLRRVKRYNSIGYNVLIVNFIDDTRYATGCVASHDKEILKATCVRKLQEIDSLVRSKKYNVIAIDEGQFFEDLHKYVTAWADELDCHIVISGLDGTSEREPFGDILRLIPHAEEVERLSAFCAECRDGTIGIFSKYYGDAVNDVVNDVVNDAVNDVIKIGTNYKPVCRKHFTKTSILAVPTVSTVSTVPIIPIDYTTKSREELVNICKKNKIKGYNGKKKHDIILLIEQNTEVTTEVTTEITTEVTTEITTETLPLLEECLKKKSIKEIADALHLCTGTVKRWLELKDVPIQYTFDLHKIISRDIDYTKYSSSLKDQFFTPTTLAEKCWATFKNTIHIEDYTFIEPSAGDGSFFKLLPPGSIGLDIEPRSNGIQKQDYLTWKPSDSRKYIVFGNPPFGLRGHLALHFINHSYEFADYVCFILPQLFESDGKGSPRKRVKYNLIYSETLSAMFYNPENQEVKINCVFQIWSKYTTNPKYNITINSEDKMKVYSLSDGGTVASTRNKDMIGKCDIYLPSTCFGKDNMKIYNSFDDLPGKKGYGIVFFIDKKQMIEKAKHVDWSSISFLSTNSAYNLRTSIIFMQLS